MSFSTLTNILTMLLCSAVLIQSVRLIRFLRTMKGAAFGEMVAALDVSTSQAKAVLDDLRETLRVDCAANAKVIASGTAMREELVVMAGIADAVAERIVEAVGMSNPQPVTPSSTPATPPTSAPKPTAKSKPQAATQSSTQSSPATKSVESAPAPALALVPKSAPKPEPVAAMKAVQKRKAEPTRKAKPAAASVSARAAAPSRKPAPAPHAAPKPKAEPGVVARTGPTPKHDPAPPRKLVSMFAPVKANTLATQARVRATARAVA